MKIDKIELFPPYHDDLPTTFGLHIYTDNQERSSHPITHINLFALADNLGIELHRVLPAVAEYVVQKHLGNKDVETAKWTYTVGKYTSDVAFKRTEAGQLYYMEMSKAWITTEETVNIKESTRAKDIWTAEEYAQFYASTPPEHGPERVMDTPRSALLVPCRAEGIPLHHLFCKLVHSANIMIFDEGTTYFLADPVKLESKVKQPKNIPYLETKLARMDLAVNLAANNSIHSRIDFGHWACRNDKKEINHSSLSNFSETGIHGIASISRIFNLPFIPIGLTNNSDTEVSTKAQEIAYTDKIISLDKLAL